MSIRKNVELLLHMHEKVINDIWDMLFDEKDEHAIYLKYVAIDIFDLDRKSFCVNGKFDDVTDEEFRYVCKRNGYTCTLCEYEYCLYYRVSKTK